MLHLQEMVKQGQQTRSITVSERLPQFFTAPCELQVTYQVEGREDFYLIHLHVNGMLHLKCQRCLDEFSFPYDNQTLVAVCRNDERAEQLLEHYECIVSSTSQMRLEDVLIDELHLYSPQFHQEISECSSDINQFLSGKSEFY